jgi:hypothetical protein
VDKIDFIDYQVIGAFCSNPPSPPEGSFIASETNKPLFCNGLFVL